MTDQELPKRGMLIMAHPDDPEFGSAGAVATWVKEGWDFTYVICTDGSGGGSDDATDVGPEARRAISQIRKKEQREACDTLGVKELVFLDYPDGQLMPDMNLRRDIVRLLRTYRPTRVVIQSPDRVWHPVMSLGRHHPDHMAAGQGAIAAIYPASQNPWDFPELLAEGYKPHKVREVFIAGSPNPNFFVDTTPVMDQKIKALSAHASQLSDMASVEKWVREWGTRTGEKWGVTYAEEFHRTENG